jgi:hypothetical protein
MTNGPSCRAVPTLEITATRSTDVAAPPGPSLTAAHTSSGKNLRSSKGKREIAGP